MARWSPAWRTEVGSTTRNWAGVTGAAGARLPEPAELRQARLTRVALSASHPDPTNNAPGNVRGPCQRCLMLHATGRTTWRSGGAPIGCAGP